jgi:hypothetical protein
VIERIRKNAARKRHQHPSDLSLQRLRQLLRRSEQLLDILAGLQADPAARRPPPIVSLFTRW